MEAESLELILLNFYFTKPKQAAYNQGPIESFSVVGVVSLAGNEVS